MLYSGKSQCLGIRSTPPSPAATAAASTPAEWKELANCARIVQCSVGHDGQHCLLVADDGSVFFVGVSRRGEDGDSLGALWCKHTRLLSSEWCVCVSVYCVNARSTVSE